MVDYHAPVFTAGAITQEKDSQTYDILLATPLTNGQIVLGSLLSRLFFVIALLVSGIPIFSITQIFGGVSIASIVKSFGIAAATAFVTGALAMAIAVFKVGTRRTIFSFYLFVVIYLVGVFLLDRLAYFKVPVIDIGTGNVVRGTTSWFTGLHPFLALQTIFKSRDYMPPAYLELPPELRRGPLGWYLSNPATRTMVVYTGSTAQHYQVRPDTAVYIESRNLNNPSSWESKDFRPDLIRGKLEVTGLVPYRGLQPALASLTLRPVSRTLSAVE